MASVITINLVSDRAKSLPPELTNALHIAGFDRAFRGKAQFAAIGTSIEQPDAIDHTTCDHVDGGQGM